MTEAPLATIQLHHATLELWPEHVRTIFHEDAAEVPAAPNGSETVIDTAIHEFLHSAIAQAWGDKPSECLRAVADGDGRRWTDARRFEEALAFGMGPLVKAMHLALCDAYGRDHHLQRATR